MFDDLSFDYKDRSPLINMRIEHRIWMVAYPSGVFRAPPKRAEPWSVMMTELSRIDHPVESS